MVEARRTKLKEAPFGETPVNQVIGGGETPVILVNEQVFSG